MKKEDYETIEMTPDQQISAVKDLQSKIEDNFVQMGQLLSNMKQNKLFRYKGYKNFKSFFEEEYNLPNSTATKLIKVYNMFFKEMQLSEFDAEEIGFDRLNMIHPMLKDANEKEAADWVELAKTTPITVLREEIKEIRNRNKEKSKTMKEVFVEQYLERMVTFFNCSKKELNFKLALYFQDNDLNDIKNEIDVAQQKYEDEVM